MKPRLAIIGIVGVPAQYGGFETLVEQLLPHIELHFEVTVYCSGKFYKKENRQATYGNTKLVYLPFSANGIGSIPYDMISILHAAFKTDYFLILGVSGCVLLPIVKFFTKKKAFVNIDGIEWKRNKWNKLIKVFLRYSEIMAVESAEGIITDNQVIKDYLKMTYDYESYLIEYGGDQAFYVDITQGSSQKYTFLKSKYAFTVCRIEPENNLHVILEGMSQQTEIELVIVGNWQKSAYGKELKQKYKDYQHIHLLNPIYDPTNLNLLRSNCHLYLHGHSAGGTNPSLVEAMNLGLPIIAFDIMYNRETTEEMAQYFEDAEDLLHIVENINESVQAQLAADMKQIANKRYTWKIIAEKYIKMILPKRETVANNVTV